LPLSEATPPAVRPFLLLATRAEDRAADDEYAAFLRFGGLSEDQLVRVRLEQVPLGQALAGRDLDAFSGIILGGSPFTTSDAVKSATQHRVEGDLAALLDEVVPRDFPFLGACYGVGTLGVHQGGIIGTTYGEPVTGVTVELTPAGTADPLLGALPQQFEAFVGHKEAVTVLPGTATLLASSAGCPVQAFRVGTNVYATQFHPELDVPGILTRVAVYRDAGYFPPGTLAQLQAELSRHRVTQPPALVRRFVELYSR
jgi:GMP synthase (glutamine-hydrolysing)